MQSIVLEVREVEAKMEKREEMMVNNVKEIRVEREEAPTLPFWWLLID